MSESQRGRIIDGTTIAQEIYRDVEEHTWVVLGP